MRFLCGICQDEVLGKHINVCAGCLELWGLDKGPLGEWEPWQRFAMLSEWDRRNHMIRDAEHEVLLSL